MICLRPIKKEEFDFYVSLAKKAHATMTSLPKNLEFLKERIDLTSLSFSWQVEEKQGLYIFVLEDTETNTLLGTSCLDANPTRNREKAFYQITKEQFMVPSSEKAHEIHLLIPKIETASCSEFSGLFLLPEYRKHRLGKLLSYGRFLFLKNHLSLFTDVLAAEFRGFFDKQNKSPFWEHVGKHFFPENLLEVFSYLKEDGAFLKQILPRFPIYIELLPKKVQNCIGKVHVNTKPAFQMLQKLGFKKTGEIDIFDGGPRVKANKNEISLIQKIQLAKIHDIHLDVPSGTRSLICRYSPNFLALEIPNLLIINKNEVILEKKIAEFLNLKKADVLCYLPI